MSDLRTKYLGLQLEHPFVVGACPLSDSLDGVRRAEDGGAAAIVFRSLFEEQLDSEAMAMFYATESHAFAEAANFLVEPSDFKVGREQYLEGIRRAKGAVGIPVIGSLNGTSPGGWLGYGRSIQDAGADALELNIFDVPMNERVSAIDLEHERVEMVRELRTQLHIPLAVKLGPFHTSLPHFGAALQDAGANGLVLFNRFFEPDIDIVNLDVLTEMHLSTSSELLLRLRWLAILSGLLSKVDFAVTGGVHTAVDAIKSIMCGASAVLVVAAVLKHGPQRLRTLRAELDQWLDEHEYESSASMRGCMNIIRSPNPNVYSRANYLKMLQTWESV
jgi:dihydroorotate dehydrogenase (fumarate)